MEARRPEGELASREYARARIHTRAAGASRDRLINQAPLLARQSFAIGSEEISSTRIRSEDLPRDAD